MVAEGTVRLLHIENDKYAGRILADIVTDGGIELREAMLESGLARPYDGGSRDPWCGIASLGG
jgi:endonuclease YncB( thermonuclease family)